MNQHDDQAAAISSTARAPAIVAAGIVAAVTLAVAANVDHPHRAAAAVLGGLVAATLAGGACAILWRRLPAPRADQQAVAATFPPEQVAASRAAQRTARRTRTVRNTLLLGLVAVAGATPLGAEAVRRLAEPVGGSWLAQLAAGSSALLVAHFTPTFPIDLASSAAKPRASGRTRAAGLGQRP